MNRKQGSYVRSLCKMAVSLLLIAWIISRMDLTKAWNLIVDFNVTYLEPILALTVIGIFICVWKWSLLLRATGPRHSFVVLLRLFWIGLFFSNFLPGRAGGDLVRAYGIARHAQNRTAATLSVIVDRGTFSHRLTRRVPWVLQILFGYPPAGRPISRTRLNSDHRLFIDCFSKAVHSEVALGQAIFDRGQGHGI